jgi:hypothetical protein
MARENQGLQIALIIFVALTIILGVTTYLAYREYDKAAKSEATMSITAGKNDQDSKNNKRDADALKKFIGFAATDQVPAIEEEWKKDMEKYGVAYPEVDRFYRPLLKKMQETIDARSTELTDAKAEVPKLQDEHKKNMEVKDSQVGIFQAERDKANTDLASEQAKFQTERERITRDQTKLQADFQVARRDLKDQMKAIDDKFHAAEKQRKDLEDVNVNLIQENREIKGEGTLGAANGEITWVNQRNATVWINLGRADGLMRQVTFSVYPADITKMTAKDSKGSIEVTQILGDHLAQARVLADDISHPILPEDKVFTPVWNPGEKRHFALAGVMDIDDDGRNQLDTVIKIITINGGVVDCYANKAGEMVGKITVNTNCLVMGKRLTDKADARQLEAYKDIRSAADSLRLQQVQLGDLLQRMGWKNMSPVVHYGHGANLKDFRAQPEPGVPKKSSGNVSDLFEKRQPPKAHTSAY